MTDDDQIDPKFFNFVAQVAHMSSTYAITLTAYLFFGAWGIAVSAAVVLAYAIWHEFWYDPRYENAVTRGSGWEDFSFLMFGPVLVLVLAALVQRYG